MKAIVLNQAGSVDNFIYQEVERPTPQKGEILIKTKYVGVNPMDAIVRSNEQLLTYFLGEKRPAILGWDVSGDVVAIGEAVTDFNIGDAVFTCVLGGGYAEYVIVKPEHTVHKPKNISYQEAAAVPIAAIPAWEAVAKIAQVKQGDKVLIHAGSGGVGHFAIQIAKSYGAYVIATSSAKNRDFVLSLGADRHIDYQTENFYDVLSDIDTVFDTIGFETREHSFEVLKKGGTLVSIIPPSTPELETKAAEKNIALTILIGDVNKEVMTALATLLQDGKLKPHVSATFAFSQMAKAHNAIESKRTVGKIVVEI